jgi:voltage-gated potassium channel
VPDARSSLRDYDHRVKGKGEQGLSFTRSHRKVARRGVPRPLPGRRSVQLPRILVRIYLAIALLVAVIAISTIAFFYSADEVSWSDALYMTLITVTTVGYGEAVPLRTFELRMLASVVALIGFGAITFLFTSLAVFFLESDLDYTLRRRRMEKQMRKMQGHYIVCGFGRV